jgi:ribonuclease HII
LNNKNIKDILTGLKGMSLKEIKQLLDLTDKNPDPALIELIKNDPRKGVQKVYDSWLRKKEAYHKLIERYFRTTVYERRALEQGRSLVAGMDEAGRGPLAGPVVAACVVLDPDVPIIGLDDSKKLSAHKRELLFEQIKQKAIAWSIGIAGPRLIDNINILQATRRAMKDALKSIDAQVDYLLIDAVTLPGIDVMQKPLIEGESKSASIAAASIVAKVTRDQMMIDLDKKYPGYGFAAHKGYGTKDHIEAIKKLGPCKEHRYTFAKVGFPVSNN